MGNKVRSTVCQMSVPMDVIYAGSKKTIKISRNVICQKCNGAGGANVSPCNKCHGKGIEFVTNRFGLDVFQRPRPCQSCKGEGEIIKDMCKSCKGAKKVRSQYVNV